MGDRDSGNMLQHWLLREPSLSFGLPVYVCAAIIFPLHLGWTGTPPLAFAGYLVAASILFSVGDAYRHWSLYEGWPALVPQSVLTLMALAVPAALAFSVGAIAGPVDESLDEEVCASRGAAESDTTEAEADDTFDVTPDCRA